MAGASQDSDRNEYQKYFLREKWPVHRADKLADCLEIWELRPPGILKASSGHYSDSLNFFTYIGVLKFSFVLAAWSALSRLTYSIISKISVEFLFVVCRNAGRNNPESPAIGRLDTGFLCSTVKQTLSWFSVFFQFTCLGFN
jgi:hypothetical protein